MKYLLLALLSVFCFHTSASYKASVVTRDDDMDMVKKDIIFKKLDKLGTLETNEFKIVLKKSNAPLVLSNLEGDLLLKAASVYYHLEKARNYFVNELESDYVKSLPQIIIRLELTNQFNSIGHFGNDNLSAEYNNALSIPPGKARPRFGVKEWKHEIWFRPVKKVSLPKSSLDNDFDQVASIFSDFKDQSRLANFQQFISQLYSFDSVDAFKDGLFRTTGSVALIEAAYFTMKKLYGVFQPRKFFLDTAMIPEVVYHEFAHVALSDKLELSHSSAINEGMADFFAASIANSSQIAHKVKEYAKRVRSKDAFRDQQYSVEFETNAYANIDFVLGVLWKLKAIDESSAAKIVYGLRNGLSSSSNIRVDLIKEILTVCKKVCPSPFTNRLELLKSFHDMGL